MANEVGDPSNGQDGPDDLLRRQIGEILDGIGGDMFLPAAPGTVPAAPKRASKDVNAVDTAFENDARFAQLIEELSDRNYGDAIVCSYGAEGEAGKQDYDLTGYILPGSNRPDKVVAVFSNGFFCVIFAPKNGTKATFQADFMPGRGAFHIQMDPEEDMSPEKRFLSIVMERCDPRKVLRSDLAEQEVEAWETFKAVLESAERLKAEREGTQERQSARVWEGLLKLLGHEPPKASEADAGEA